MVQNRTQGCICFASAFLLISIIICQTVLIALNANLTVFVLPENMKKREEKNRSFFIIKLSIFTVMRRVWYLFRVTNFVQQRVWYNISVISEMAEVLRRRVPYQWNKNAEHASERSGNCAFSAQLLKLLSYCDLLYLLPPPLPHGTVLTATAFVFEGIFE